MLRFFHIAFVLLGLTMSASWSMKAIAATESPNVIVLFVDEKNLIKMVEMPLGMYLVYLVYQIYLV